MKNILAILVVGIFATCMFSGCISEDDDDQIGTKMCYKCVGTTIVSKEFPETTDCSSTTYPEDSEPNCDPTVTYEDLLSYSLIDSAGVFSVNSNSVKINSARRSDDSYLRKAIPIGTSDFKLEFDFIAEDPFDQGDQPVPDGSDGTLGGNIALAFVNSPSTTTIATMISVKDGLYFSFRDWTSIDREPDPPITTTHWFGRIDGKTDDTVERNYEEVILELNTKYHVVIERVETVASMNIYSEGGLLLYAREIVDSTDIQYFLPQTCRSSAYHGGKVGSGTFNNFKLDY